MYNHILIATDGSELAQKAAEQGLVLAAALGTKVTAVTVTEQMQYSVDTVQGQLILPAGVEPPAVDHGFLHRDDDLTEQMRRRRTLQRKRDHVGCRVPVEVLPVEPAYEPVIAQDDRDIALPTVQMVQDHPYAAAEVT